MFKGKITREAVIKDIISIFIEEIGFFDDHEKKTINENTHIIKDFKIDGDDISFFIMEIEKYFSVKPTIEDWGEVVRLYEIADVVIKKMNEKS